MLFKAAGLLNARICSSIRNFSYSRCVYKAPPGTPSAASVLLPRSLIAVHGYDSAKFLNGLITTRPPEYTKNANNSAQFAAMLNAKGRVIADLFVYPAHDVKSIQKALGTNDSCYLLDVDNSLVEKVLDVLDFHILLSNVKIDVLKDHSVYTLWNDEAEVDVSQLSSCSFWSEDKRAPGLGYRLVVNDTPEVLESLSPIFSKTPLASLDEYRLRRYLFGLPEGPEEIIPGKSLPMDSCIDYMGGIDFEKGCYMGQELTIRTKHHGNVRKRIMPVVFTESPDESLTEDLYVPKELEIEPGADIRDESPIPNSDAVSPMFGSSPFGNSTSKRSWPQKQRPSGNVISSLGNIGLAKMRIDTLGHEFKVDNLYVKPMTPFWWPAPENE